MAENVGCANIFTKFWLCIEQVPWVGIYKETEDRSSLLLETLKTEEKLLPISTRMEIG